MHTSSESALILLGSNLGLREQHMAEALQYIEKNAGSIVSCSSLYETAPWGYTEQGAFLNQVLWIHTSLRPEELLYCLQEGERVMGRQKTRKWGERIIDLDILYYGERVIEQADLQIPHPGIPLRRFTLVPMAETAPDWKHPLLKKNPAELLAICPDNSEVKAVL